MRPLLAACVLAFTAFASLAQPAPWPTRQWATATPESQGLDPVVLADMVDHLAAPSFNTTSVIVVRNGRIVAESYAAPFRAELRHDLRSVTKSVVATLVGAAIQEGRIAGDSQKVLAFFPQHKATGAGQEAMTVRDLLDMRSGIVWREWPYNAQSDALKMWGSPNFVEFVLARDVVAPGEKFQYIAAAPHLLSAIVSNSTGSNAASYARRHLFKTLGIDDFSWQPDPQGISVGESSLRLKPRDMARIGLLHLRGGQWDGQQLLPPGWAESLFTPQGPPHGVNPLGTPPTYRNLWWTDASVPYAAAMGRHGQMIVVLPRQDIVLVVTSKTADNTRGANLPELVNKYLLKAIQGDAALPDNAAAAARLAQAMQRFANRPAWPESQKPSASALAQSRRAYVLEPNDWGYREFALELTASEPHYWLIQADKRAVTGQSTRGGPMGLEGRFVESTRASDRLWARRGRWLDDKTFRIETQHLEASILAEWTATFLGDGKLELLYTNGDGDVLKIKGQAKD
jgi:CubicO group peptidase (beta-lactamase class C family)